MRNSLADRTVRWNDEEDLKYLWGSKNGQVSRVYNGQFLGTNNNGEVDTEGSSIQWRTLDNPVSRYTYTRATRITTTHDSFIPFDQR